MNQYNVPSSLYISEKFSLLNSSALRRPAAVVRQRRNIFNRSYPQTGLLQCRNRRFSPGTGAFNSYFNFTNSVTHRGVGTSHAACWAANGVLLRDPLKPTQPAELVQIVSPSGSVIVISVLLNVAFMCTIALAMFFLIFRFHNF